jgi:flagellin
MASNINTNINSLTAQRNLSMSQASLTTSMQRLSSGLRINSAKDDAAGLAISERMTSQIRGLSQASRNANDGISLAQTAEGALGEINSNLQRIRELAVQSANATNTSSDRASLNLEVQQRLAEIDRVSAQTAFNGQKLLDGTFGNAKFQVGADVAETISIDLTSSMRNTNLGRRADYVNSTKEYDGAKALGAQGSGVGNALSLASGDLKIAVGTAAAVAVPAIPTSTAAQILAGQTVNSAWAKAAAINSAGIAGLTAEAHTSLSLNFTTTTDASYTLTLNGESIVSAASAGLNGTALATSINQKSGTTGVVATFAGGVMKLEAADGRNINITQTTGTPTATDGLQATAGAAVNNSVNHAAFNAAPADATLITAVGTLRLSSNEAISMTDAANTPAAALGYTAATPLALGATSLSSASVTTAANANSAIYAVDAAMSTVSSLRATFGAMQNRFDSVIANLGSSVENLSASRARIQDADFATETANLSRSQILQQAGTAMVAQANQLPQGVLALLR